MPAYPGFTSQNPFWEGFEEDPEGRMTNFLARFGSNLSPFQQRQLPELYKPVFQRYQQQAGQQVLGGQQDIMSFSNFLDQFNPQRELLRGPQDDRSRLFGGRTIFDFGR